MTHAALQWNKVNFSVRQGFWMTSRRILHNLEISIPSGIVLGLVGPNGAGKTTTIKLGAGLLKPDSGEVLIYGRPATEAGARKSLGLLTETQYIYPYLKLGEWLTMLAGFSGLQGARRSERIGEVSELLELKDRLQQMMHTLSKGQLQRAGFAQVLIHDPDIMLLDEPMSGLDPYWRYRMQKILLDLKAKGKTILFSSHILADVERLSDQVALIEGGKLQWIGRLSDLERNIRGYEVICRTDTPDILKPLAEEMILQPEGQWQISISAANKDRILEMASNHSISIEFLRPIQDDIEEVLFRFAGKKISEKERT